MNVVNFNDVIAQLIARYPDQHLLAQFKGWEKAPLFDYVTTYDHEKARVEELMANDGMRFDEIPWPFELFRLGLAETAVPWDDNVLGTIGKGRYCTNYVASRQNGAVAILAHLKELWDEELKIAQRERMLFFITGIKAEDNNSYRFEFSMNAHGQWTNINPMLKAGLQPLVGAALTGLVTFIVDAMAPTTHIAKVVPNQPHRSIEWQRQRTHYTLIAHGHPANRATVAQGERVKIDAAEELTRMAHNRRAHFRTLRHERFRFARGKQIFVRATWVGPKEWKDEGGRQIYRILEPVEETTT